MDLTRKQYEKMEGNKPAKKQTHHSLATMMGAKQKALEKVKKTPGELSGELLRRGHFDKKGNLIHGSHNDSLTREIKKQIR